MRAAAVSRRYHTGGLDRCVFCRFMCVRMPCIWTWRGEGWENVIRVLRLLMARWFQDMLDGIISEYWESIFVGIMFDAYRELDFRVSEGVGL